MWWAATESDFPPGPTRSFVMMYPAKGIPCALAFSTKVANSGSKCVARSWPAKETTANSIGSALEFKDAMSWAV